MITSKVGQTPDTGNFIHGCFMVRVGTDFNTYLDIMRYALQDEIHGTNEKPGLEKNVETILNTASDDLNTGYLPVYFSKRKCRDSSLGGNDAINPLPQFCLDDDIVHPHYQPNYGASVGMGQVYSENYDDTQQILYMGFGIPVYSNVGNFWSNAVDQDMANLVNKGGGSGLAQKIGELIGSAPIRIINIATIPSKFIAAAVDGLSNVKITKYYAFSSQMPMYFRFVNTIFVMLATNMNIMGSNTDYSTTGSDSSGTTSLGLLNEGTQQTQDVSGLSTVFKDYGLDMAKIMLKRYVYENGNTGSIYNRYTDEALFEQASKNDGEGIAQANDPTQSTNPNPTTSTGTDPVANEGAVTADTEARSWSINWFDGFKAAYGGAIYDGHLFIGFRIDKGLGASESFSNSTGESQLAQVANAKFQEGQQASFASMGGRFGTGSLGSVLTDVVSGAMGVLQGVANGLRLDPLAAVLTGSAKIDIPEVWMSSNYSRSASFSITCLSPYGDMESIFMAEYVPLACILAGALPRGTGLSSHSAPFICQAYCRGIFSSPLCMIESLEITRGADQFGFNAARLPLKLSMNVTLKDLTPTMYMTMGGSRGLANAIFGTDDSFGEYMLTLSGMGLRDRLSPFRGIRRKTTILLSTLYKNKLSPFMLGMEGGSRFLISRVISTIVSAGRGLPGN